MTNLILTRKSKRFPASQSILRCLDGWGATPNQQIRNNPQAAEVNVKISKVKRICRKYAKKLKGRFIRREITRKQFNIICDERLIQALKFSAKCFEMPVYVITEHAMQLGLQEIHLEKHDAAYKENLQRHLIKHHLLVDNLDPIDERLGNRVRRLKNAMRFLKFFETTTDVKEQREILIRLINELMGGGRRNDNKSQ